MEFELIASVINGLLIGAIYGLAAIGLTLIFGVMNVINLMHGATIAVVICALYLLVTAACLNSYFAIVPVFIGGFIFVVAVYWIAVHLVIVSSDLMTLLATFAVNMILIGVGTAALSTSPYNVGV